MDSADLIKRNLATCNAIKDGGLTALFKDLPERILIAVLAVCSAAAISLEIASASNAGSDDEKKASR